MLKWAAVCLTPCAPPTLNKSSATRSQRVDGGPSTPVLHWLVVPYVVCSVARIVPPLQQYLLVEIHLFAEWLLYTRRQGCGVERSVDTLRNSGEWLGTPLGDPFRVFVDSNTRGCLLRGLKDNNSSIVRTAPVTQTASMRLPCAWY